MVDKGLAIKIEEFTVFLSLKVTIILLFASSIAAARLTALTKAASLKALALGFKGVRVKGVSKWFKLATLDDPIPFKKIDNPFIKITNAHIINGFNFYGLPRLKRLDLVLLLPA